MANITSTLRKPKAARAYAPSGSQDGSLSAYPNNQSVVS
jgi:hypothetical protein